MKDCSIWVRWFHRRQRQIDEKTLFMAIAKSGTKQQAVMAIALYLNVPSAGHWRCPCASRDRARVDALLWLGDPNHVPR